MVNSTAAQLSEIRITYNRSSSLRDPVSCITHLLSAIASVITAPVLFVHAAAGGAGRKDMAAVAVFILSMILLYGASASYHGFPLAGEPLLILKRLDHMMIFVLIAGTYTPVCICGMKEQGTRLLTVVWLLAAAGILFKLLWVTCPRWVSSAIYISMGWVVVFAMPGLIGSISSISFLWLLAGGIIYTIGGVIYALKLFKFNASHSMWGSHEIFHLFVMAGTICHFISVYHLF